MKRGIRKRSALRGRGPNGLWFLLLLLGIGMAYLFWYNAVNRERESIPFTAFLTQVEGDNVKAVAVAEQLLQGELRRPIAVQRDGRIRHISYFETNIVPLDTLWPKLHEHNVTVEVYPQDRTNFGAYLLLLLSPLLLLGLFFMMRQGQGGGGGKIFNIGKSKAKFFSPNTIKIKFKDVAGVHEAKEDLRDIVEFLKSPEKFKRLGAKIPRGVLLTGQPGNGKTMLAKAVAGEASVPFFSVSGSDFVEVFVGVGASRVRDLFAQARRNTPCIIFIDEIDAVGRHRGAGVGGGNDEREQTLNQLLSEMDGFTTEAGEIIVLAATNRPDVLDSALLRPGRFDRKVEVPYPDMVSREQILKIHTSKVKLSKAINMNTVARGTARFSGADLANLVNEAALLASKNEKKSIDMEDFESARDKILVGAERKTLTRTQDEIRRTAYHEAGHTLVMALHDEAQPLHKVTILSRGGALGITWYLPEGDQVSKSEAEMLAEIQVCLGGRIAEEIIYGKEQRTTGAHSDFKGATKIARDMVMNYGMSELGAVIFEAPAGQKPDYSEATAQRIDEQISKIVHNCYTDAQKLLNENKDKLETLTVELLEKETLEAREVYTLLGLEQKKSHSFVKGPSAKVEDTPSEDEPDVAPAGA